MGYRYAILGAGRQGLSAGYDLGRFGEAEKIVLYDIDPASVENGAQKLNRLLADSRVTGKVLDVSNKTALEKALKGTHSTISAVPYRFNPLITEVAVQCRSNLCDLGGHSDIVRKQLQSDPAAKEAGITITPDCGMGPGLNISMGVYAMSYLDEPEELFIWDGGLPLNPIPPWNYLSTFNINGLTNEYTGSAYFLRGGKVTKVPTLTEIETLEFSGPLGKLEAAVTSGGLSTAPWTFEGKLQKLENKTLRYPGHWNQFRAFKQLGLFGENPIEFNGSTIIPREVFHALLEPEITVDEIRDICVIRVQCNGKHQGKNSSCTLELIETHDDKTGFTAMEKLTGWHASMVAILAALGKIPKGGVPVEKALGAENLSQEVEKRKWKIQTHFNEE